MKNNFLVLLLLLTTACGKVEQVQDKISGMLVSNNIKLNSVRVGFLYRTSGSGSSYDYLEYENTQYRIGTVATAAQTNYQQIPAGTRTEVYFTGNFAQRSGISSGSPSQIYDVVDLSNVIKK